MLFILGATVFNVIVAVISFFLLFVLYAKFLYGTIIPSNNISWAFSLLFIASIAISIFVYRIVLKFLLAKFDLEKYFDPLFVRKSIKKQG